jgi:2-phospho-L-lactate guanylyltransferase (CobY/MobA/RfbA family)
VAGIGRICLVGPEQELRQVLGPGADYDFVPAGQTLTQSLTRGLEHFRHSEQLLFVTADLPLLTPQAVSAFIEGCAGLATTFPHNLLWAAVTEDCYRGAYRLTGKGFNRFRDLAVCHGNLMMTTPELLENRRALQRIDAVYAARKNSVRAALAIGWKVGLSYLCGVQLLRRLTLEQMAEIVSRRFEVGLVPVLLEHPEVTIDVDEPEDFRFVRQQLEPADASQRPCAGAGEGDTP